MILRINQLRNLSFGIARLCIIPACIYLFDSLSLAGENENIISAVKIERAVVLDGVLSESNWERAIPISDFTHRELHEGEPATGRGGSMRNTGCNGEISTRGSGHGLSRS